MRTWQQNPYCSFLDPLISFRHTYIHTLLRLPSPGLFIHNVSYYIKLVIKKRKLIYSSSIKFKIHSKSFKIHSELFCMKYIIKKCPLKTINIFRVLNIVSKPIPFPWTPKIKLRNGKRAACNHGVMDARGRLLSTKEA